MIPRNRQNLDIRTEPGPSSSFCKPSRAEETFRRLQAKVAGARHATTVRYIPSQNEACNARNDAHAVLFVDIAGGPGHEGELFRQRNPDNPGQCYPQELSLTLDRLESTPVGIETMLYDSFEP